MATIVGDGTGHLVFEDRTVVPGHLVFEDRTVVPGMRYAYRLSVTRGGASEITPETWLEVPVAARFALHAVHPNPAHGPFTITFELPDATPAALEVLDIAGRRVASWAVGALGAGAHDLPLDASLPAGIYVVRLTRAGHSLAAKACVVW